MAKVTDVYKRYQITSSLQQHQLRVAAVAKMLCESLSQPVDTETVTKACLIHDMGNIIKFDLNHQPELLEPEGTTYWAKVQKEFIDKYGDDEHEATLQIARELGASQKVLDCIDAIGFSKINGNHFGGTVEQKICNYADMRVAPYGVVDIHERLADGRKRYSYRKDYSLPDNERSEVEVHLEKLEEDLFKMSHLKPSQITEDSIQPIIEELKEYEI